MKTWQLPIRLAAGAYTLNSGLSKRGIPDEAAAGMHGMASGAFPQFSSMESQQFIKLLSAGEIALGTALLLPFVPAGLVGAGLSALGAGLVRLYLKTPGMTDDSGIRPTPDGIGLAKDVWLFAIGLALLIDGLSDGDED